MWAHPRRGEHAPPNKWTGIAADARSVLLEYGPGWAVSRGAYEVGLRSGLIERQFPPAGDHRVPVARASGIRVEEVELQLARSWAASPAPFFLPDDVSALRPHVGAPDDAIAAADGVLAGRLPFFHDAFHAMGNPPDWLLDPVSGSRWARDAHWTRVPDLSSQAGDIKRVWEPSRFTHTFVLARAFAATGDARYADAFWAHVESWLDTNLPEQGPHWRCGQEMADRVFAWVFGMHAFRHAPAATPELAGRLLASIWHHAQHIAMIHWYAKRCVRNNHSLSEAAALFTVGSVFPFLPEASAWRQRGLTRFSEEIAWQVYDDGAFVQHSSNYARLAAQLGSWMLAVAQASGEALPAAVPQRLRLLLHHLVSLTDPSSGRAPNFGANDGTLLLPLASCDYEDFRPAAVALATLLGEPSPWGRGPWEEEARWLSHAKAPVAPTATAPRGGIQFPEGGLHVLRSPDAHVVFRCGAYRHRPSQADMLHVDFWYGGHNLLIDAGSFSYNAPAPWKDFFSSTRAHNTLTVDERDQMRRGPKFMWLDWTHGRTTDFKADRSGGTAEGWHDAYRPFVHRRRVRLARDACLVLDEVTGGDKERLLTLHWHLPDLPLDVQSERLRLALPEGHGLSFTSRCSHAAKRTCVRGDERAPRGWHSRRYGRRTPAWSVDVATHATSTRFATLIHPESVAAADHVLQLEAELEDWLSAHAAPTPHGRQVLA